MNGFHKISENGVVSAILPNNSKTVGEIRFLCKLKSYHKEKVKDKE